MKLEHEETGLKIKFTWKEIFRIVLRKSIRFEKKSTYMFYTHFMHMISDAMCKYGDGNKHGKITPNDIIKTK
tara:strand:+ start:236 stop:451 length:216 start_codon:yes stop_codon:yes gene_type:complete